LARWAKRIREYFSATALAWTITRMHEYANVVAAAKKELDEVLAGGEPEQRQLSVADEAHCHQRRFAGAEDAMVMHQDNAAGRREGGRSCSFAAAKPCTDCSTT